MTSAAHLIREHHAAIMARWTERAAAAASAKGLFAPVLQNVTGRYLSALADDAADAVAPRRRILESHLSSRVRLGYVLPEIVEEIVALGTCIAEVCAELPGDERPDASVLAPVLAELQRAATSASDIFWQHLREDEQVEKGLLRRIQGIASASRNDPSPSGGFTARLDEVLAVVAERVPARCLTIVFANGGPSVAASVGEARDACGGPPSPELRALFDAVARTKEGSAIERTVGEADRTVVVRLPEHGELVGLLYAVRAEEPFAAREVRRLEAVGALLGVLLENARLDTALRRRIEEVEEEKRLRETFVSILAHDLRGPLGLSRLAASTLAKVPDDRELQKVIVGRIVSGIDRVDRMVTDLLDANRIRAGERLALALAPCDLAAMAREVVGDLAAAHGSRFVVGGERTAEGIWSADHLRRIVANLATNAAKYGAPATPIHVDVRTTASAAVLSVHNAGEPIPDDALPRLFEPFSRARTTKPTGAAGWGLGLALVKGSVEAHGGSVSVESSREAGTTFTVVLPLDSRPFQAVGARP